MKPEFKSPSSNHMELFQRAINLTRGPFVSIMEVCKHPQEYLDLIRWLFVVFAATFIYVFEVFDELIFNTGSVALDWLLFASQVCLLGSVVIISCCVVLSMRFQFRVKESLVDLEHRIKQTQEDFQSGMIDVMQGLAELTEASKLSKTIEITHGRGLLTPSIVVYLVGFVGYVTFYLLLKIL